MTAALVVIVVVALLAIAALVVTARRAGAMVDKERGRSDRLEAQVRRLEEAAAAAAADAAPATATPAAPVDVTRPEAPTPVAAEEPGPIVVTDPAIPVGTEEPAATVDPEPAGAATEPATPAADLEPGATEPASPGADPEPAAAATEPATPAADPEPAGAATEPATPAADLEPAAVLPAEEPAATADPEAATPASESAPVTPAATTDPESPPPVPPADRVTVNSHGGIAAKPLLELERLRLEREWADIAGTATPLPVPWDGSVRGVVAVELDIIREVIGTPSRIEPATIAAAAEPAVAVATARLATEILRRLAKAGEEISVTFVTDTDVTMAIAVEGHEVKPDLSDLTTTAAQLGGRLTLLETDEGFEAQLRVPSLPS